MILFWHKIEKEGDIMITEVCLRFIGVWSLNREILDEGWALIITNEASGIEKVIPETELQLHGCPDHLDPLYLQESLRCLSELIAEKLEKGIEFIEIKPELTGYEVTVEYVNLSQTEGDEIITYNLYIEREDGPVLMIEDAQNELRKKIPDIKVDVTSLINGAILEAGLSYIREMGMKIVGFFHPRSLTSCRVIAIKKHHVASP
jgi:hypothetical protein